jgi:hypothetical protein
MDVSEGCSSPNRVLDCLKMKLICRFGTTVNITGRHGVTSENVLIFISTTMRKSNFAVVIICTI